MVLMCLEYWLLLLRLMMCLLHLFGLLYVGLCTGVVSVMTYGSTCAHVCMHKYLFVS